MRSERHEMDCIMDINIDVYPIDSGMRLTIAWAKTIDLEGMLDTTLPALAFEWPGTIQVTYQYIHTNM